MASKTEQTEKSDNPVEVYACTCGFTDPAPNELNKHLLSMGKSEPGKHKSKGLINRETEKVIMPPASERTPEQRIQAKKNSQNLRKKARSDKKSAPSSQEPIKTPKLPSAAMITRTVATAQQIQFVPKTFVTDYSPILRAGQEAAIQVWGWPKNMSLGDFLDTVVYYFFQEHNITLAGYIVEETEEDKQVRENAVLASQNDGEDSEKEDEEELVNAGD
jgi:hypothetical protein